MNLRFLLVISGAILLSACVNFVGGYQEIETGWGFKQRYGYKDKKIADNTYELQILYRTSSAEEFFDRRAKELCNGKSYQIKDKKTEQEITVTGAALMILPIEDVISNIKGIVICAS